MKFAESRVKEWHRRFSRSSGYHLSCAKWFIRRGRLKVARSLIERLTAWAHPVGPDPQAFEGDERFPTE
jgi:hypothetical protein